LPSHDEAEAGPLAFSLKDSPWSPAESCYENNALGSEVNPEQLQAVREWLSKSDGKPFGST
jgi:hypothetical protein